MSRLNLVAVLLVACGLLLQGETDFTSGQAVETEVLQEADRELFAARYRRAAELYSAVLDRNPARGDARYGLVRALLKDHRHLEAYAVADEAMRRTPESPESLTAAGMAALRRGDLLKAEELYRSALKINPNYHGGLRGLASIQRAISQHKSARQLMVQAYRNRPNDPELMVSYANTFRGAEHISMLLRVLPILDPESEEAGMLRAHIAADLSMGEKKAARLVSPYAATKIKLRQILNGPRNPIGWAVRVRLNQRQSADLLLDTGASGISVSPRIAERAGLMPITGTDSKVRGIGDKPAPSVYSYSATEVQIDKVVFADYPIGVFRSAGTESHDGLIGSNVFGNFVIRIDFPNGELLLEPRPGEDSRNPEESDEPVDVGPPARGFHRVLRFGHLLAVPTSINGGPFTLFGIDSGATTTVVDTEIASTSASVYRDDNLRVQGIQGAVNKTSRTERAVLRFAGFQQENASLVAVSLNNVSDTMGVGVGGLLGMPILGLLNVTIDYRENAVRFEYKE